MRSKFDHRINFLFAPPGAYKVPPQVWGMVRTTLPVQWVTWSLLALRSPTLPPTSNHFFSPYNKWKADLRVCTKGPGFWNKSGAELLWHRAHGGAQCHRALFISRQESWIQRLSCQVPGYDTPLPYCPVLMMSSLSIPRIIKFVSLWGWIRYWLMRVPLEWCFCSRSGCSAVVKTPFHFLHVIGWTKAFTGCREAINGEPRKLLFIFFGRQISHCLPHVY